MKVGSYLVGMLLLAAPAFGKTVVTCDGGEELQLKIVQKTNGSYDAAATVQSFGDSYPVYHYGVTRHVATTEGGPLTYTGKDFKLVIHVDEAPTANGIRSDLSIPDIGVDQTIDCQLK